MLLKKTAPIAAVVLAGALLLTGCTSTNADKPASTASATTEAGVEVSSTQEKLIEIFSKSHEKALKDGYTETASDGSINILISYDPELLRTVTEDSSTGTATYVEGPVGLATDSIKMFLEGQSVDVTEKDGVYTIKLPDNPDTTLNVTVKDGVVTGITSATKDAPTWEGTLTYKVTSDAKAAFAKATPAPEAPVAEGDVPVEELPAE